LGILLFLFGLFRASGPIEAKIPYGVTLLGNGAPGAEEQVEVLGKFKITARVG